MDDVGSTEVTLATDVFNASVDERDEGCALGEHCEGCTVVLDEPVCRYAHHRFVDGCYLRAAVRGECDDAVLPHVDARYLATAKGVVWVDGCGAPLVNHEANRVLINGAIIKQGEHIIAQCRVTDFGLEEQAMLVFLELVEDP